MPIEDNFLRVAEAKMTEHPAGSATEVEMVLMGLGGYSTENELGLLRSLGLSLDPDLVILNFFVGNDVTGIPIRGKVFRGRLYYEGSANPWVHLMRRSWLFLLVEKVFLARIMPVILGRQPQALRKKQSATHSHSVREGISITSTSHHAVALRYLSIQARRMPVYLRHPDDRMQRLWREAEGYLLEFDATSRNAGIPWILHAIPSEMQVDAQVRRSVLKRLSLPAELYDFDEPQRRLRAFARTRGITISDPLTELRTLHRPEERLYIPNNTHWNVRGNRIAGEMLADFAVERIRE